MVTNREDVSIAIRSAFLKKGTQQKFSLIALILISVILLYVDTFENRPLKFTRSFVKDIIYKGSTFISLPGKTIDSFFKTVRTHFYIHSENLKLKEENSELKNSLYNYNFIKVENNQLKSLLSERATPYSTLKNAKVIIDKNSPFIKSIIINKGSKEKIKKGMAVLDKNYFIGRTVEVNFFSSRVLLVTDLNSRIPVIIEPNGYQAILTGDGESEPKLEYLPKSHEIKKGNVVYTSGKDGIFSPGIPIGKIIYNSENISVSLFSNITQLSYVNVDLEPGIMEEDN